MVGIIVAEAGFTRTDAEGEVSRGMQTLMASADESRRLAGDVILLAGAPLQENRIGFTLRVPDAVVCAITPFNAPLNTQLPNLAPALAARNSVGNGIRSCRKSRYHVVSITLLAVYIK